MRKTGEIELESLVFLDKDRHEIDEPIMGKH